MYDDIIHLAMDQQLLTEIRDREEINYKKLPLMRELLKTDIDTSVFAEKLRKQNQLTFQRIFFEEPIGYHLMKSYLISEHSVDKAVFLSDVEVFKTLQDPRARLQVAQKIYERFCKPQLEKQTTVDSNWKNNSNLRQKGISVFEKYDIKNDENNNNNNNNNNNDENDIDDERTKLTCSNGNKTFTLSLITENTNSIGVYGRPITKLESKLRNNSSCINISIFDEVSEEVYNDLRLDVFPRFERSKWFEIYLKCKSYISESSKKISIKDFHQMRMLGRGAFGCVNACKKKDTGKLYAMKQINKKRVQATDSIDAIMSERNFLAMLGDGMNNCRFVTALKYAFCDDNTLYLILDLMIGGDLKYHLNHEKIFSEERSKFYAAQVLLGLQHIHSKKIVYRDLKLENVLMDDKGNIKLSDLGLAVRMEDDFGNKKLVRGYAGTPGYTAPEVVLGHYYDVIVDFFSLGVMIYRFLCGKKPFQSRNKRRDHHHRQRNQTAELDRNVVEMEPPFPPEYFSANARSLIKGLLCKNNKYRLGKNGINEIKNHPWFDNIDFGLLEAGYLDPPFVPALDEIHAEQQQHIGRPPQDDHYQKTKITPQFENALKQFSYVNQNIIQQEVVQILKKINKNIENSNYYNKYNYYNNNKNNNNNNKNKNNNFNNPLIDFNNNLDYDHTGQSCMACLIM